MSKVKKHFDKVSKKYDFYKKKNKFYYSNLKIILSRLIPVSSEVLEIGCGTGDLLYNLKPKIGYGMDISDGMIKIAREKYKKSKNLQFSTKYPENKKFDYIFMSDVIEHLEDPKNVFNKLSKLLKKDGIFINTMANPIWEPVLMIGEKMGLKMPEGPHNRISDKDIKKIVNKSEMKVVKQFNKLLIPIYIPIVSNLFNNYLEKYLKKYAFIQILVAKKV